MNDHPPKVGDVEIPCCVLENGRRVLSLGGMIKAPGMSIGSAGGGEGDRLASFASGKVMSPVISHDLANRCQRSPDWSHFVIGTLKPARDRLLQPIAASCLSAKSSFTRFKYSEFVR